MRRILVSIGIVLLALTLGGFVAWRHGLGVDATTSASTSTAAQHSAVASDEPTPQTGESHVDESDHATEPETTTPEATPAPEATPTPEPAPTPTPEATPTAEPAPTPEATPTPAAPTFLLDRPLRVVSTRWEPVAPALLANGSALVSAPGSAIEEAHLRQVVRIVGRASEVEEALALGGATEGGADIAILPLASWVAA